MSSCTCYKEWRKGQTPTLMVVCQKHGGERCGRCLELLQDCQCQGGMQLAVRLKKTDPLAVTVARLEDYKACAKCRKRHTGNHPSHCIWCAGLEGGDNADHAE